MSDIDDLIARCKVIAGEAKVDAARIERRRWKPLAAAQEPRVAPNWAKRNPKGIPAEGER